MKSMILSICSPFRICLLFFNLTVLFLNVNQVRAQVYSFGSMKVENHLKNRDGISQKGVILERPFSLDPNEEFDIRKEVRVVADGTRSTKIFIDLGSGLYPSIDEYSYEVAKFDGSSGTTAEVGKMSFQPTGPGSGIIWYTHPKEWNPLGGFNGNYGRALIRFWAQLECPPEEECDEENPAPLSEFGIDIFVARPPVMLVHGLWGKEPAMGVLQEDFYTDRHYLKPGKNEQGKGHTWNALYIGSNAASFSANSHIVPDNLEMQFSALRESGISAGKIDVVTHSMGGILTRQYLQSGGYRDDILRHISMNTPHSGSQMANFLMDGQFTMQASVAGAAYNGPVGDFICEILGRVKGTCYGGAVEDLQVNSNAINNLNTAQLNNNFIPVHTIGTTFDSSQPVSLSSYFSFSSYAEIINYLIYLVSNSYICPSDILDVIFMGQQSDGVVALSSQLGGVQNSVYSGYWHPGSSKKPIIIAQTANLLENGINNTASFSTSGYGPVPNFYISPAAQCVPIASGNSGNLKSDKSGGNSNKTASSLAVTSPAAGQVFAPNEVINIEVAGSPDIDSIVMMVAESEVGASMSIQAGPASNFQYTIPAEGIGHKGVAILGLDSEQRILVVAEWGFEIRPAATLDSISVSPDFVILRKKSESAIQVTGHYADGINRNLSDQPGITMFFQNNHASQVENSQLKGEQIGTDTMQVGFAGVLSDTVRIAIASEIVCTPLNWYADSDADGFGNHNVVMTACDKPMGYVNNGDDCDDSDASINPNSKEACNGKDDNCDGQIDEGTNTTIWYADADGDGFGNGNDSIESCVAPNGYVDNAADCDDTNAATRPDAEEICNGKDDNCDGIVDNILEPQAGSNWWRDADGDGYGDANEEINNTCSPPAGYVGNQDDCDDANPTINPSASEVCNGIDDNCDGIVDEGCAPVCTVTITAIQVDDESCPGAGDGSIEIVASTDGTGQLGYSIDGGSNFFFNHLFFNLTPGTYDVVVQLFGGENCAATDIANVNASQNGPQTWYKDLDADGYTDGITLTSCTQPTGYVPYAAPADCDDNDGLEHPGQTWYEDIDGDGYGSGNWLTACQRPADCYTLDELVAANGDCDDLDQNIHPAAAEVCNGLDDDCDGEIDEGTSGGLTWAGNVSFFTQTEIDNWSSCYAVIDGNLTISGLGINELSTLASLVEVTGNVYVQSTGLSNVDGFQNLTEIGGTLTIIFNSSLTGIDSLYALTDIGGSLMMYYNFNLSNCCAFYNLLDSGGVGGAVLIYLNKNNCNGQSEIINTCTPPAPMVENPSGNQEHAPGINESGAKELRTTDWQVYPNPASSVWNIKTEAVGDGVVNVRLYDLRGHERWAKTLLATEKHVQASPAELGLRPGIYWLRMTNDAGGTWIRQVIFK